MKVLNIFIAGLILTGFLVNSEAKASDIYLTYKNGVACFSDYPKGPDSKVIIHDSSQHQSLPKTIPYSKEIKQLSAKENIDPKLVAAVVKAESNFNPAAVSKKGAGGLMQLMPATAKKFQLKNVFNIKENLAAGIKVLKNLLSFYKGDKKLALAAYNAGHNAVKKYSGVPPYSETQNYIKNVLDYYQKINQAVKTHDYASAFEEPEVKPVQEAAVPPPVENQKIYRLVDKNGSVLFTNLPPRS